MATPALSAYERPVHAGRQPKLTFLEVQLSSSNDVRPFFVTPDSDRIERTARIARQKGTDLDRWSDPRNLDPRWKVRSARVARLIAPGSHVLDLGAGARTLKPLLPDGCRYTPCDLVARTADTIVADLNRGEFPQGNYDVVTAVGLLEYIHHLDPLFVRMRQAARSAVVSYCALTGGQEDDRLKLGWLNNLTQPEFIFVVVCSGWNIVTTELFSSSPTCQQWLFVLRSGETK
jgi:hypothetical protein